MAAYFSGNGTDIQSADGLQTLYLMNPGYVGFPEAGVPAGNVVLINQHAGHQFPGSQQQFVGIPLPATAQSFMGNQSSDVNLGFMASNLRQHSPLWRNAGSELSFVQSIDQASPTAAAATTNSTENPFQFPTIPTSGHQPIPEIPPQHSLHPEQQGGLSLSLSSTSVHFMAGHNPFSTDSATAAAAAAAAVGSQEGGSGDRRVKWEGSLQSVLLGSKYLKAAQELLDEVVNVGKRLKTEIAGKSSAKDEKSKKESASTGSDDQDMVKKGSELTAAERQEFQMKKAKLVTMLEEVDQRYKQYHHEMQMVVSSFEAAAGAGAAKAYTELALQTISKQFRCLRDAISDQIRQTSRSLGEEDCIGTGKVEGWRLRFVDQQLRQQRALQQLGMMQHNAWRPQRGLPERSVSVLRAWLFEHFLHPYPKDADKHMLAKQTGLTRSQVSNWFINARVRLWKPMVEEMYMEETKGHENQNNSDDKTSLNEINEDSAAMKSTETDSPTPAHQNLNTNWNQMDSPTVPRAPPPNTSALPTTMSSAGNLRTTAGFGLIGSSSPDAHIQLLDNESVPKHAAPKRIINNGVQGFAPIPTNNLKPAEEENFAQFSITDRHGRTGYAFSDGFSSYHLGDVGRYSHDTFAPRINTNGVSLTLGLPHCDSVLSLSGAQSPYLPSPNMQLGRRHELGSEPTNDFCTLNPAAAAAAAAAVGTASSHPANGYENINIHTRKRFAAQLLSDFVT